MKTALFLGAGASAFVDLPTTKKLMDMVRKRADDIKMDGRSLSSITKLIVMNNDYADVEKLYDGIDMMLRIRSDIPNLRPIFDILHGSDGTFKQTLGELGNIRSVIRDVLLESFTIKSDTHNPIVQMYDMVRSVINDGRTDELRVFTTNYDTVMETYAHMAGLEIVNGFMDGGHLSRVWADNWDRSTDKPPLYLTKLHGSVNWYEDADGNIVEAGGIPQRDANHDIMIAPTEGVKDYDWKPFPALMKRFKESIRDVDVLLVIGFSYRDEEIVNIIKGQLDDGMALISFSTGAVADIRRVSDADVVTMLTDRPVIATAGTRIALIDRKFEPKTIKDMRPLLEVAYRHIQRHNRSVRRKDIDAAS